ncbi:hypothetical protein SLEP1_g53001 [Rubroshorea leprosula]|uniref:Uncharacterized protein n=1 Tax=Rubroshorea leprosula TaxID=152421 RepID=A0AAV5M863_9ROSI|nr:hypothetical protein SLEP1_g53001 [Rubroshorea leprosula]
MDKTMRGEAATMARIALLAIIALLWFPQMRSDAYLLTNSLEPLDQARSILVEMWAM